MRKLLMAGVLGSSLFRPARGLLIAAALAFGFGNAAWATPISIGTTLGDAESFVLLATTPAVGNGSMDINGGGATITSGDVGFSSGVATVSAQKVNTFNGHAYVQSTAENSFFMNATLASFAPTGGIRCGTAMTGCTSASPFFDTKLNNANTASTALGTLITGMPVTSALGAVSQGTGGSLTLTATSDFNLYTFTSWDFNGATLTLNADGHPNAVFAFEDIGTEPADNHFSWSQSSTVLNGTVSGQVVFDFPTSAPIEVNKGTTVFDGTILALNETGSDQARYHNTADFEGRIISNNILVDSAFSITLPTEFTGSVVVAPEPGSLALLGSGLIAFGFWRRRQNKSAKV